MSIDDFIRMMQTPESLNRDQLPEIQELVDTFPYFHSGHLLLLKNLHNIGHIRYNTQLKDSSVYIPDRKLLYHLIHDIAFAPAGREEVTEKKEEEKTISPDTGTKKAEEKKGEPETVEMLTAADAGKEIQYTKAEMETVKEKAAGAEEVEPSDRKRETTPPISTDSQRSKEELLKEIQSRLNEIGKAEKHVPGEDKNKPQKHSSSESNPMRIEDELFILEEKTEGVRDIPHDVDTSLDELSVGPADNLLDIDPGEEGKRETPPLPRKESPQTRRTKKKTLGNVDDLHGASFTGWLDYFHLDDHVDIQRSENQSNPDQSPNNRLIDDFLAEQPRIIPRNPEEVPQGDIAGESVKESGFFSETLAKIYLRQGYYTKAIYTYEKLRLKYPEKSSYFASQIEMIRKRLRDQTQN